MPKMPSTTTYRPFDVVLVSFPFTDLTTTKQRPGLVLAVNDAGRQIVIAMITSKVQQARQAGDCHLKAWSSAGLLKDSLVRLSRIATLETSLVRKKLGEIAAADQNPIRKAFRSQFAALLSV